MTTAARWWRDRALPIVAGWVALLVVASVVGRFYQRGRDLELGAIPWVGKWGAVAAVVPQLLLAALACAAAVWFVPAYARRAARLRHVVLVTVAVSVAITFLLAWAGPQHTRWPMLQAGYGAHTHYVDDWGGLGSFLRLYVHRQPGLPTHLKAHPPGLVVLLWGFEHVGLSGRTFQLVLMLLAGALASAGALVAAYAVAGSRAARAAAPFVAFAPVLVWRTNADVIFAAAAVSAVALVLLALHRDGRRSEALAVAGGAIFGAALLMTYGVAVMALPVAWFAWRRRRVRTPLLAALAVVAVIALPRIAGFWWFDGLAETRVQYFQSVAHERGYAYWLLGNAAVFAALLGPATFVGLVRGRDANLRMLALAGLACAVVAGLSGLTSAETERIWQPFAPLVLVAGAGLWAERDLDVATARRWLALQLAIALGFQAMLRTGL